MTLTDAEASSAGAPAGLENTAVFQLDLGPQGIAIDLTDDDWRHQIDRALTKLEPLIFPHSATGIDRNRTRAFVDARTAELVEDGAVSLILLPTGSDLAPVAIGAVFVQPTVPATCARWSAALTADGWTVAYAAPPSAADGPESDAEVIRGSRCLSVPGVAALELSERLVLISTPHGVITVLFQDVSTKTVGVKSASPVTEVLDSVRWKKD